MIELKFINAAGDTMDAINNEFMTLVGAEGLHGVDNEMSSSTSPYFDGDNVEHIRTSPRSIALTYKLTPPIAEALKYFNRLVKSKQKATLIETDDYGKQIKIEGIVTVPPYTRWSNSVAVQIQLYCSKPYWRDMEYLVEEISGIINHHYFPIDKGGLAFPEEGVIFGEIENTATKMIFNDGDIPVGALITIVALGKVTNPVISNNTTGEWIQIIATLEAGDFIEINTNRGEKSVRLNDTEIWDKVVYNGTDWLQIATGYNELTGTANDEGEDSNVYFSIQVVRGWQ